MHRFALWIPANIILVVILNPDPYYDDNKEEVHGDLSHGNDDPVSVLLVKRRRPWEKGVPSWPTPSLEFLRWPWSFLGKIRLNFVVIDANENRGGIFKIWRQNQSASIAFVPFRTGWLSGLATHTRKPPLLRWTFPFEMTTSAYKGSHLLKKSPILWKTFIKWCPPPPSCICEILIQIFNRKFRDKTA